MSLSIKLNETTLGSVGDEDLTATAFALWKGNNAQASRMAETERADIRVIPKRPVSFLNQFAHWLAAIIDQVLWTT